MTALLTPLRRTIELLGAGSPLRLIAPLTAAYAIAYLAADVLERLRVPWVQAALVAAAGTALLWPRAARRPSVWWAMAAAMSVALARSWMLVDNHVFLATYWLVALAVARSAPAEQRDDALARAASALLGLTMLFATAHKLRAPELLSGDFFHLTFLTEARFSPLGWLLREDLGQIAAENAERIAALESDPSRGAIALRTGSPAIHELARVTSWVVVGLELALAVLWLARSDSVLGRRARHGALLAFAVATYAVAPVAGFGSMLVVLGLADTRPGEGALRACYLATLVHVLFGAAVIRALSA